MNALRTPILILVVFNFVHHAQAESLNNWIALAQSKSERFLAINKSLASLDSEIKARDLVLSGQFSIQAENFNNDQDAVTFARRSRSRFVDFIYTKPFSTGTLLSATTGQDRSVIDTFGVRNTADWEIRLTQSLWRDAFGRGTALRHEGEKAELLSRRANLYNEKQLLILDLEAAYWELAFALKEEKVRLKNIEVSKRLKNWTLGRLQKTAAEKSDLLQAEALLSSRELDLTSARNQIETLQNRIRQILPLDENQRLLPEIDELEKMRRPEDLLLTSGGLQVPQRLDAVSSAYMAQQSEIEFKKIRENFKPELNAYVSYGQNGIAESFDESWNRAGNDKNSGTRFGVTLQVPLDLSLIREQERALALSAQAQKLNADALFRATKINWDDLIRRIEVSKSQVLEATRLYDFQHQKVEEERRRYRLGRSTVFQLVSFEVEEAEAEIRKLRFLVDLRKLESQARLFTGSENI